MDIVKERSRLIFTNYNDAEKRHLEDLVGTMDNVFAYEDQDNNVIAFPPGMESVIKKEFPKIQIVDKSNEYWDYDVIEHVEHNAQPRNQLQIDFIKFVLENAAKKQKLAGILSPGTGKAEPISTKIPTPTKKRWTFMGDLKAGDQVYGSDGSIINVIAVFPQGVKDIFRITLIDGTSTLCSAEHLWQVKHLHSKEVSVVSLVKLMRRHYTEYGIPVWIPKRKKYVYRQIKSIIYDHDEEAQCIMVDSKDHLYRSANNVITHNTFMACYSSIQVGLRTLIIVPTSGIKVQWAETLINMFKVPAERVKVVNSPKDFINVKADFVIVSQASLSVLNKTYDLAKIMERNKFGIKVIDEVQMWFHNIIKVDACSNICHNWYLTGTFGRSGEEENALYQQMFGDLAIFKEEQKNPTIFNRKPGNVYGMKPHMHVKMIWMKSGLSKEEVRKISSSMRYSERAGKWVRYGISIPAYTELTIPSDGHMTKFLSILLKVVKIANQEVTYGKMLILVPTINATNVVFTYLKQIYPDRKIGTIHSRNSKADNERVKAECEIMISTVKSCGTGFDVKDLSKLVVAEQFKSWILADQVSGRLRRRPDGKDTYMWDIADSQIPQLRAWANARADVLRKKSKTFKVVDM